MVRTQVVQARRFRWLHRAGHAAKRTPWKREPPVAIDERMFFQGLSGDPLAKEDQFRLVLPTSLLAHSPFDALAVARASLSDPAFVDDVAVQELQVTGFQTWFPSFMRRTGGGPGSEGGEIELSCTLSSPLSAPPVPDARPGEITFEAALWQAQRGGSHVVVNEALDRSGYWFFPVWEIGSFGVVVEKSDGRATTVGSAWDVETWLWGYERGLVDPTRTCLVVDAVRDLERTLDVLRMLRRSVKYETRRNVAEVLASLPARFPHTISWSSIPSLREADGAFAWRACHESPPADSPA